jgi:hypothetical protein
VDLNGATMRVFLGEIAGEQSPVPTFTPLLGAEIVLEPAAEIRIPTDPRYEHGVVVDTGTVRLAGSEPSRTELSRTELGYLPTGTSSLVLANPGDEPARVVLLGGAPFEEDIVMWWNFVGRTHDEIVAYRQEWAAESERFGRVEGYRGTPGRLPAPPIPSVRLKPRSKH